jgi:serine phosphatase RsbU (regulator of sigma subunit)
MVVTKALTKNAALRKTDDIGNILTQVSREMARENPEQLFVTAIAGILNVENGKLDMVIAGHDAPLLISSTGHIENVVSIGGPPLCVMDEFSYPVDHLQLAPGDTLFLLTDGITEAMNENNELFGMGRVDTTLQRAALKNQNPESLIAAMRTDVRTFVGDKEPYDDLTLLVLRWKGNPIANLR